MNKYLLFSLFAISPLILHAEKTGEKILDDFLEEQLVLEGLNDEMHVVKPKNSDKELVLKDSNEKSADAFQSNALEKERKEPFSLETMHLAEAQKQPVPYEAPPAEQRMCQDPTMCMPDIEPHQVNLRHTESQ